MHKYVGQKPNPKKLFYKIRRDLPGPFVSSAVRVISCSAAAKVRTAGANLGRSSVMVFQIRPSPQTPQELLNGQKR